MRYTAITSGKPFQIAVTQPLILQCCSCGLVHTFKFKLKGEKLEINVKLHESETKKVRGQARVKKSIRELGG